MSYIYYLAILYLYQLMRMWLIGIFERRQITIYVCLMNSVMRTDDNNFKDEI